jgi:hypothetical protein
MTQPVNPIVDDAGTEVALPDAHPPVVAGGNTRPSRAAMRRSRTPAYAAAPVVAPSIRVHLLRHVADAERRGESGFAALPDEQAIAQMIDAAFWTSLRREEGFAPKISLAFVRAQDTPYPLMFEEAVPLEPTSLTRVAPAVERPGIHLAVAPGPDGDLAVWGIARAIPKYCCVVEVAEPGLLVVKHHRGDTHAKFVNLAVLQGDQVKVVDEDASTLPDCPSLLGSLLGFDSPATWAGSVNVLVQLAVSMRAHRRGGLMLVVPNGTDTWRESVVRPMTYAIAPAFAELAALSGGPAPGASPRAWREELNRAVDAVGGLTAIDGATVLTASHEVLTFGAKIVRRRGSSPIEQLTLTEPIEGTQAVVATPGQLGGTRHLAAAQFVHDQPDALALVASQDGRFTVFAWSPCEGMVHAHRIETLLL